MKISGENIYTLGRPLLLAILLLNAPIFGADTTNQWNVKVVAVMVVAPDGGPDFRSYCWKPGVTVSVALSPAEGQIVKFNQDDSKINSFTDDKGTDLTAAPPSQDPFNKSGISYTAPASDKGDASIIVDLKASGQPAKGATTFAISGTVNAQIASSTKQFTADNVEIKTNVSFTLGDLPITIANAGTNRNSWMAKDYNYSVTFSSLRNLDSVSSLEFFDSNGKQN